MKTALVVDDLESVRFYHQLLLTQSGYQTLVARNGAEALGLLEQHAVDLVMLDLVMPTMSGAEFMRQVRAMPRCEKLPVLVISSEASQEAAHGLRDFGACEVLQKPILPDALLAAARRIAS